MSNDFWLFDTDSRLVDPAFLDYFVGRQEFEDECARASEGTTNRVRLQLDRFLSLTMPLPPLQTQRAIAERLDELGERVTTARALMSRISKERDALLASTLSHLVGDPYCGRTGQLGWSTFVPIGEAATDVADGPHVTPQYVETGIPFITVLNITSGFVDFRGAKFVTPEAHQQYRKRAVAEQGDVLISKDGTIGVPCYIGTDREFSFFVSVALVKPKRDVLDGRFLAEILRTPYLQERIRARSRGDMIKHLVLREIRDLMIPLPPLEEQDELVQYLAALRQKVAELEGVHTKRATELETLVPAGVHAALFA